MASRSTTIPKSTISRTASGDRLKEKRGTSPSNPHTTTTQRSTSDANQKQMPNYLKPTISIGSRNESSKAHNHVKKNNNQDDSSSSQKLLRRRSFDKPPSSSPRAHKALVSPPSRRRDRSALPLHPKERTITVRSSSFSGRSTTTTTGSTRVAVLDRSVTSTPARTSNFDGRSSSSMALKTPKAVKQQPVLNSRTTKKSLKTTKESGAVSSSSLFSTKTWNQKAAKQEDEVIEEKVKDIEVRDDHRHSIDVIPVSENVNEVKVDDDQQNLVDDKTSHEEVSTVSESENVTTEAAGQVEETEEKSQQEEEAEKMEENPKGINVNVVVETVADDDYHEEPEEIIKEDQDTDDDHHRQENGDHHNENKAEGKADNQDGAVEAAGVKEEDQAVVGNGNLSAANRRTGGQAKKESPTAYNDVIEETASKLLEKRKNKVKALVGAFETVIDYESGASK